MIPLSLELKNFLSYGADIQEIDFKDYSLICFSGKNGNGKSALLDAITWALWGQARKVSGLVKPDEGLLRLGQTRMMVSLKFNFAGQIYRVRREYSKTYGKPLMSLDFDLYDQIKDKFLPLTDKSIKQTQENIEKLLGLDYQTFINSAFFKQGGADEFSKKTPKDRKQILSNILGFSRYDDLMSLALNNAKKFGDDYKIGQVIQENILKETSTEQELKIVQLNEDEKLKKIKENILKIEENIKNNEIEYSNFLKLKDKYAFFKKELDSIDQRYQQKSLEYFDLVESWKKTHYQLIKLDNLSNLENQKKILIEKDKIFTNNQKEFLILQEELLKQKDLLQKSRVIIQEKNSIYLNELKLIVQRSEIELNAVLNLKKDKELELKDLLSKKNLYTQELNLLVKELAEVVKHEFYLTNFNKIFEKRRSFYAVLVQKGNWLKSSLNDIKEKLETIKKQESPVCPLCEQVLTLKRKAFLSNKFLNEFNILQYRLLRPSKIIKNLKDLLLKQHEELKKLQEKDGFYKNQNAKFIELQKTLNDLNTKIDLINKLLIDFEQKIVILTEKISNDRSNFSKIEEEQKKIVEQNPEILNINNKIKELELRKNRVAYDSIEHNKIQISLSDLEKKLFLISKFDEEKQLQLNRRSKINSIYLQLKELKINKLKLEKDICDLKFNLDPEAFLHKVKVLLKQDYDKSLMDRDIVLQSMAKYEHELLRIKELKDDFEKRKIELEKIKAQFEDYQILANAFSKNGIQALLIEQVIPQIEEEANNILARLTDNQAQIFIESLRDLKGGGVRETLDIKISDSTGVRPYEMFSGGEAFRIDFALRIAISKLLAKRSGIALQTLIIDEGFGSQDEDGLSRLMDAIYTIKSDFTKIIIVSHLDSLKENFPVHFIVSKNASGSFVTVYERG
ncbi:SMC family ATPase [Candidatus Dependentiae bacterium]|nr:SMC family ATPase [Candidatus Dependentiae bacterium]MBU4387719.1 SMC family ATPase [Candidatus Dependentiae bacterium]